MYEGMVGEIKLFAGNYVPFPSNWAACDGKMMPIENNTMLFSVIGTSFGGNGHTTFALPKLTPPSEDLRYVICVDGIYPSRG